MKKALILLFLLCFATACGPPPGGNISETTRELKELYEAEAIIKKADRLFKEKDYTGAIEEYKRFLDLHPLHEYAPYAQYRIGLAYFNQIDTIDRDITPVQKAYSAFSLLIKNYPNSKYVSDAKEKLKICREKLAEREFYVGYFYMRTGKYKAAIARFETVLTSYKDTSVVPKTLYYMALTYKREGRSDRALENLNILLARYPESPYKSKALRLLKSINKGIHHLE